MCCPLELAFNTSSEDAVCYALPFILQYKLRVAKQGNISDLKMEIQNVTKIKQSDVSVGVSRAL